mmetsp:Transcript_16708/g.47728  ORF Transcript_16708/g.47728 Transcript_16708/m.47728 type:complete len:349 (+) Transcript_16708:245-1291(+)
MLRLLATLAAASAQNAKLVIVAQFKNEAESLPQWLDHYLTDEGVAAMLLVDDNSTDSWRQAVEPYGARVRVRSGHAHRQVENYNLWLPTLRSEYSDDWVLIVDVDEYAYARRDTLADAVRAILDPGPADSVLVAWKQFGSAGHRRQPKNGTVCGFTTRRRYGGRPYNPPLRGFGLGVGKAFARIRALESLGVHRHRMRNQPMLPVRDRNQTEASLASAAFALNHYPMQSRDWFQRTKMRRGDARSKRGGRGKRTLHHHRAFNKMVELDAVDDSELGGRRGRGRGVRRGHEGPDVLHLHAGPPLEDEGGPRAYVLLPRNVGVCACVVLGGRGEDSGGGGRGEQLARQGV